MSLTELSHAGCGHSEVKFVCTRGNPHCKNSSKTHLHNKKQLLTLKGGMLSYDF